MPCLPPKHNWLQQQLVGVALPSKPYPQVVEAEVEEVEAVEVVVEEEFPQAHQAAMVVEEEPWLDHPPSQENWEATHQKNSTETERKAKPFYSTFSSIEEWTHMWNNSLSHTREAWHSCHILEDPL